MKAKELCMPRQLATKQQSETTDFVVYVLQFCSINDEAR